MPARASAQIPFECATTGEPRTCWYVDSNGTLQGVTTSSELTMGLAVMNDGLAHLNRVDLLTYNEKLVAYNRIMDLLRRRWTVAARLMVSNSVHTNVNTIALATSQIVTEWTNSVNAKVQHDIDTRNAVASGVMLTFVGALSFNALPAGPVVQNAVFQVLMRGIVPMLLEQNGYSFGELPRQFSSAVQSIAIDSLETDIQHATSILLQEAALHYLLLAGGEARLTQDSENQEEQVRLLSQYAGTPARQADIARYLLESRTFRLIYAAKLATLLGPRYEEHLNSFIVTGSFNELAWVSTGASARGAIFDLYTPEGQAAQSGPFAFLSDARHKRVWHVNSRWQLEPQDCGLLSEGRFTPVRLVLPYWDEPVKPYGEAGPALRGSIHGAIY